MGRSVRRRLGLTGRNLNVFRYSSDQWLNAGLAAGSIYLGGVAGAKLGSYLGGTAVGQAIGSTAVGKTLAAAGATAAGAGATAGALATALKINQPKTASGAQRQQGDGGFYMPALPPSGSDIDWASFFDVGGQEAGPGAQVGSLDPLSARRRRTSGTRGLRGNRDRTFGESATIASAAGRAGLNLPV